MASQLKNITKESTLSQNVTLATSWFARAKGLLGKKSLTLGDALWIDNCNNIHTMFMKFSIDVIFVDKKLIVKNIYRNIPPWRPLYVSWRAHSVFEFTAGSVSLEAVEVGDQLYVSR